MANESQQPRLYMNGHTSTMPASSESQRGFRFLELPLEMRNLIYAYLQETYDNVEDTNDLLEAGCAEEEELVAYVNMIPPYLRQINRQIKDEVEKQMRIDTTFIFEETDPGFFENAYPKFLRSMITHNTNHVVLKLQAWCIKMDEDDDDMTHSGSTCTKDCTAVSDIINHTYFAGKFLVSFPWVLKSCEIELSLMYTDDKNNKFDWSDAQHGLELYTALEDLVKIPGLTALRVFKDNIREAALWMTWEKRGWHSPANTSAA